MEAVIEEPEHREVRNSGVSDSDLDVPAVLIVGKRKPSLIVAGNEAKIENYVKKFDASVERYRGVPFGDVP